MQISAFFIEEPAWVTVRVGNRRPEGRSSRVLGGHEPHSVPADVLAVAGRLESAAGSTAGIAAGMAGAPVALAAERSRGSWSGAGGAIAQASTVQARCVEVARANGEAFAEAAEALERGSDVEEPLRRTVEVLLPLGEAAADVGELAALV